MTALTGCNKTDKITDTTEKPVIKIGSDNYPPYNFLNEDGMPTGIDVDLATEAFGRMGYQAVFKQINWEEKRTLLEDGKIDCIWGSFSIDGREDDYNWAGPYMVSRQVVAVNEDSDIYTLQDLEGKRVAVQSTTKPEELFENHKEKNLPALKELFSLQNRELIYPFLSKGYADAIAAHLRRIEMCKWTAHGRINIIFGFEKGLGSHLAVPYGIEVGTGCDARQGGEGRNALHNIFFHSFNSSLD